MPPGRRQVQPGCQLTPSLIRIASFRLAEAQAIKALELNPLAQQRDSPYDAGVRYENIDPKLFQTNRANLGKLMLPNSLAVLNANDILPTNADGTLLMQPNSDLFYLTGIEQEETILLLYPDADDEKLREVLFLREPNELLAIWQGHKLSRDEARAISGIRNVQWLSEFPAILHRLICEAEHVYLNSNEHKRAVIEVETREARFVRDCQARYPLHDYQRLARLMHQLRAVKSPVEVELIRKACALTAKGFGRVARFVKPGVTETQVEAEFAHEFIRGGGKFAYPPIIASGANACVLHYLDNDQLCRKGDLLLLDVAAGRANYQSDLTRTIPVSGRFTRRQRQVYDAVLRVFRQCVAGLVPGKLHKTWQKEAETFVEKELVDLGLLRMADIRRQDPDKPAFKKYFMHGVGHPIGLDVHDVGLITQPMQAGWVMTCEPGIYIREEDLGVRLENDILITEQGPVDLMADIPIEAREIEALMRR
jgi:Xaa-Pro aminopeptidase